jgi:hypothetical protein
VKVNVDSDVIDWLLDNPRASEFRALIERGRLQASVTVTVLSEAVSIPESTDSKKWIARHNRLMFLVGRSVLQIYPSHIFVLSGSPLDPRAPLNRRKMKWSASPPQADALLVHLRQLGIRGLDGVHVAEAKLDGADAFVTLNIKDFKSARRVKIKTQLGIEVMTPDELLERLS